MSNIKVNQLPILELVRRGYLIPVEDTSDQKLKQFDATKIFYADVITITASTYTPNSDISLSDLVIMSSGANQTFTIGEDVFEEGSTFSVMQGDVGVTTIQAANNVTLNGVAQGSCRLRQEDSVVSVLCSSNNDFRVFGDHLGVT